MSAAGKGSTTTKSTPKWEAELWSYLSSSDGMRCPIYESCQLRLKGIWCISDHEQSCQLMNEFLDEEVFDLTHSSSFGLKLPSCPAHGRIFQLVGRLAASYLIEAGIDRPPVPTNLITRTDDKFPIEVRQVPLKTLHGAVWRLNDCWVVQLNSNDTAARQRFALYHEIFHILAHCKATPVFKKIAYGQEGFFNEMLADHFAGVLLLPGDLVREKWAKVGDISRMATIFDVPESLVWFALKQLGLV